MGDQTYDTMLYENPTGGIKLKLKKQPDEHGGEVKSVAGDSRKGNKDLQGQRQGQTGPLTVQAKRGDIVPKPRNPLLPQVPKPITAAPVVQPLKINMLSKQPDEHGGEVKKVVMDNHKVNKDAEDWCEEQPRPLAGPAKIGKIAIKPRNPLLPRVPRPKADAPLVQPLKINIGDCEGRNGIRGRGGGGFMRGRLVKRGTKRTIERSAPAAAAEQSPPTPPPPPLKPPPNPLLTSKPPPNPLLTAGLKLKIRLNGDTMATFHADEKGVASVAKLATEDSEVSDADSVSPVRAPTSESVGQEDKSLKHKQTKLKLTLKPPSKRQQESAKCKAEVEPNSKTEKPAPLSGVSAAKNNKKFTVGDSNGSAGKVPLKLKVGIPKNSVQLQGAAPVPDLRFKTATTAALQTKAQVGKVRVQPRSKFVKTSSKTSATFESLMAKNSNGHVAAAEKAHAARMARQRRRIEIEIDANSSSSSSSSSSSDCDYILDDDDVPDLVPQQQQGYICKGKCREAFSTREAMRLHTCNSILDSQYLTDSSDRHSVADTADVTPKTTPRSPQCHLSDDKVPQQDQQQHTCKGKCKETFSSKEAMRLHTCNSILDSHYLTDSSDRHSAATAATTSAEVTTKITPAQEHQQQQQQQHICKGKCKEAFSTKEAMRLHTCNSILDSQYLTDSSDRHSSTADSTASAEVTPQITLESPQCHPNAEAARRQKVLVRPAAPASGLKNGRAPPPAARRRNGSCPRLGLIDTIASLRSCKVAVERVEVTRLVDDGSAAAADRPGTVVLMNDEDVDAVMRTASEVAPRSRQRHPKKKGMSTSALRENNNKVPFAVEQPKVPPGEKPPSGVGGGGGGAKLSAVLRSISPVVRCEPLEQLQKRTKRHFPFMNGGGGGAGRGSRKVQPKRDILTADILTALNAIAAIDDNEIVASDVVGDLITGVMENLAKEEADKKKKKGVEGEGELFTIIRVPKAKVSHCIDSTVDT